MRGKQNKKMVFIISISIIILLSIFIIGLISGYDFNKLMGNSLTQTYYYCDDSTFTLQGQYCYKMNYKEPLLMGDVNKDGNISIADVTEIQLYVQRHSGFDSDQIRLADVNGDGTIDNEDTVLLQRYSAGLSVQSSTSGGTIGGSNIIGDKLCPKGYALNSSKSSCVYKQRVKAKKVDFIYGDINADKVVDMKDATLLQQYMSGLTNLTEIQKKAGDVNKDGVINILDITEIQKMTNKTSKNSVIVELSLLSKVDINSVTNNTKLDYQAKFTVNNNNQYYYKWYDVKSPGNTLESECKLVTNNLTDKYTIEATNNNEYVLLKLYNDSNCSSQFNISKSDEIKIKEEASTVSLDYKLASPILTSNIVNKNVKLTFDVKFTVTGSKKYYYSWSAIKDNKVYNKPECTLITDGMKRNPTLTINGQNQHGIWNIYSSASCKDESLVKSYSTDYYNYIADSLDLNIKSTRMTTGNNLKINATVKSNLPNASSLIKWTSSNVAVATVDAAGNVTAKKSGSTTITATIGNISSTSEIIVVDSGNDTSIACPLIDYEKSGDTTTFTITPDSNISKYDVYLSTNDHVGTYANYELRFQNITGVKALNNYYKNAYSNQAKIVVYSKNGTSRNCYTPPLTWKWNTGSVMASCPAINYTFDNKPNTNHYEYNSGNSIINSGVSKMYVGFKTNLDYQYSWYTSQKDGSYRLFKTYETINRSVKPSVTGQLYDRNAQIVVTDKYGNNIVCKTNYINSVNFVKSRTGVGTTEVYYEKNYPTADYNTVISEMKKLNNTSASYLAATRVFLYSDNTYFQKIGNSCGVYSSGTNSIAIRESKYVCGGSATSDYFKGVVKHEFGHSIDWMNERLSGTMLAFEKYNGKNISDYTAKYEKSKLCNNSYCLRYNGTYSYGTAYWEFIADLFSYDSHKFNINNDLSNLRKQVMSSYANHYNSSKSKFNELKESFR